MEATEVQISTPASADDSASTGAAIVQPPDGGSGSQPEQPDREAESAYVNDVFRQAAHARSTLKPSEVEPDGGSAPEGDVKPSEQGQPVRDQLGRFIPRRGVAEAVRTAEERAADLERQLAERDPDKIREQAIADYKAEQLQASENAKLDEIAQTQAATVKRYRELCDTPDLDISPEDYQWREDYKERLKAYPEVQQFHEAAAQLQIEAERTAFLGDLRSQITETASLPGVNAELFKKPGTTWLDMGKHLYEAGQSVSARRIAELEAENRQLKLSGPRGLGAVRAPMGAGRSSPGSAPLDENTYMNNLFRGAAQRST